MKNVKNLISDSDYKNGCILFQLRNEKAQLTTTLQQEQESLVNKLMRKIRKLEAETGAKQNVRKTGNAVARRGAGGPRRLGLCPKPRGGFAARMLLGAPPQPPS